MAVPKRKQSPSRTGMRRAQNMKFSSKNIVEDKKSGEYMQSHRGTPLPTRGIIGQNPACKGTSI